jgi:hypothetical protein
MPRALQREQQKEIERHLRETQKALIREQVMHTLGEPAGLHNVQVRRLWEDHYRVNVLVGVDAASAKVAHSYFLVADHNGSIIASTPNIRREY